MVGGRSDGRHVAVRRGTMVPVGWLRPKRRVLDPDGAEWEVYVSRTVLPRWNPADDYEFGPLGAARIVTVLFEGVLTLVTAIVVPLLRMTAALPRAWMRGRRSSVYRIEAVTWFPQRQSYSWTTSAEDVDEALIAIFAGIRRGRPAQPECAVFLGAS